MKKVYNINCESISATILSPNDAERKIKDLMMSNDPDPVLIKTFDNEELANEFLKSKSYDISITRGYPCGSHIEIEFYSLSAITLDEDGDEIDSEYIGTYSTPDYDEVMAAYNGNDNEED